LLSVGAVGLAICLAFWMWHSDAEPTVFQRTLTDVVLDWKCETGHAFRMQGHAGLATCPSCERSATPVAVYHCEQHGPIELAVRFAMKPDGTASLSEVRRPGNEWMPPESGLHCPVCGAALIRAQRDPLAEFTRPIP
jgi:hypothetical protein